MMWFTDKPDDLETELGERIRRVRSKRSKRVTDTPTREMAYTARWAYLR